MTELRKDSVSQITIDDADAGQRIDNYLVRILKGVPKSHVYRILRSGEVRVNKGRIEASYRIQIGDVLRIPPIRIASREDGGRPVPAAVFPIVFEDDALLVIDKPAGVAVHGGSGVSFGVIEQLRASRPDARYLELVHRLDRETSGLLMVAKKRSALTALHRFMREGRPDKRYLALAIGSWPAQRREVKEPLLKFTLPDGERRVRVSPEGISAHTRFTLVESFADFSLVEAKLLTGRTHQIRVHMQCCGQAIAGDDKYGDFGLNKQLMRQGLKRMFLHAARLSLPHPLTGEPLELRAPLPKELEQFLVTLRGRHE